MWILLTAYFVVGSVLTLTACREFDADNMGLSEKVLACACVFFLWPALLTIQVKR